MKLVAIYLNLTNICDIFKHKTKNSKLFKIVFKKTALANYQEFKRERKTVLEIKKKARHLVSLNYQKT